MTSEIQAAATRHAGTAGTPSPSARRARPPMQPENQAAPPPQPEAAGISRALFAYGIFYGGMVCIAGVLGNKQVALGPLAVEAGIFAFLLLVVTSSAVAELHGRAAANPLVPPRLGPLPARLPPA